MSNSLIREDFTKDVLTKDYVTEDCVPKDYPSKDRISKDWITKDGLTKDVLIKDYVTEDCSTKDCIAKVGVTGDSVTKDCVTKDCVSKVGVRKKPTNKKRKSKKGALGLLMQYDSDSGGSAASIDSDVISNHSISPSSCTSSSPDGSDKRTSPVNRLPNHNTIVNHETNNNTKPKKRLGEKQCTDKKRSKSKTPKVSHESSGYVNLEDTVTGVQHLKSQRSLSPAVVTTATQLMPQPLYQGAGVPGYSYPQGPYPFQSGGFTFPTPSYPQYLSNASQPATSYYQWAGSYPSIPCQSNFPYLNFSNSSNSSSRNVFR